MKKRRYLLVLLAVLSFLVAIGVTLMLPAILPPSEHRADYNRIAVGMTKEDVIEGGHWFITSEAFKDEHWECTYVAIGPTEHGMNTTKDGPSIMLRFSRDSRVKEKQWIEVDPLTTLYRRLFDQ